MDASLGKLLAKLKELGVARETLVVFYSDNGGLSHSARGKYITGGGKDAHNKPMREGKGAAHEGGIRVPAIVSWAEPDPGSALQQSIPVQANSRCARPIMIEDWFPTFLKWTGAIRSGDWKAIYFHESERWELYTIVKDIGETTNLAAGESVRLAELATTLRDRLMAMQSPWPVDKATGKPRVMKLPGEAPTGPRN